VPAASAASSPLLDLLTIGMLEQQKMNTALLASITVGNSRHRPQAGSSPLRRSQLAAPESDILDGDDITTVTFMEELDKQDARRNVGRFTQRLVRDEIFTVGDLIRLGESYLKEIGMSQAAAAWVTARAKAKVRSRTSTH